MQALERFYVIRPFLEDGVPLTHVAQGRGLPLQTVSRWVKRYREAGLGRFVKLMGEVGATFSLLPCLSRAGTHMCLLAAQEGARTSLIVLVRPCDNSTLAARQLD